MAQRNITVLAILLGLSVVGSSSCFAVDSDSSQEATVALSQEGYVKEREFMLKDLKRKIELMQAARTCAKKSSTPAAFQACNQAFQNGIRAHMAEQEKSK